MRRASEGHGACSENTIAGTRLSGDESDTQAKRLNVTCRGLRIPGTILIALKRDRRSRSVTGEGILNLTRSPSGNSIELTPRPGGISLLLCTLFHILTNNVIICAMISCRHGNRPSYHIHTTYGAPGLPVRTGFSNHTEPYIYIPWSQSRESSAAHCSSLGQQCHSLRCLPCLPQWISAHSTR
jgi:hypothetical protein